MKAVRKYAMKYLFSFIIPIILISNSCTLQERNDMPLKVSAKAKWVQKLAEKNPLKSNTNITCVYFRFDTIVNDFEVNGVFYPTYRQEHGWDDEENGVYLIFHSLKNRQRILFYNMGCYMRLFSNLRCIL